MLGKLICKPPIDHGLASQLISPLLDKADKADKAIRSLFRSEIIRHLLYPVLHASYPNKYSQLPKFIRKGTEGLSCRSKGHGTGMQPCVAGTPRTSK